MDDQSLETPFDDHINGLEAFLKARDAGGHTVLVLGANWCPDAIAFMAAINDEAASVLRSNARFVIVGIGRHDHNQDLVSLLGYEKLEGVPAVFVFNTGSELVNTGEVFRWRTARDEDPETIRRVIADYLKD